jgi:hypothetical protein
VRTHTRARTQRSQVLPDGLVDWLLAPPLTAAQRARGTAEWAPPEDL